MLAGPRLLAGQSGDLERDTARVLLIEARFGPESTDSGPIRLDRRVVYWAELSGPGTLVVRSLEGGGRQAYVVPIPPDVGITSRRFEVYPLRDGPHLVTVTDRPAAATGSLRLYRDVMLTRRLAEKRDGQFAVGVQVAGGFHTGYAFDETTARDPRTGGDLEACLFVEAGGPFGACIGAWRQGTPGPAEPIGWLFGEARARVVTGTALGGRRTDVDLALRLGQGLLGGSLSVNPFQIALGAVLSHHLAGGGRRRGWRTFIGWHHGWLVRSPPSDDLQSDRLTAGLIWMP